MVHPADVQDRDGARQLLAPLAHGFLSLRKLWADGGYAGQLVDWVRRLRGTFRPIDLEIVKRSETARGFQLLPRRWVVERTFGWIGRHRRLAKDYEHLTERSETLIYIAMIALMLRRLAS